MSRHHEPVGRHLIAAVARAGPDERVEAVRARLAQDKPVSLELVLVVGADGRLSGVVPIARIFAAVAEALVSEAMDRNFPCVTADTDQERAASLALQHGVDALPVVDDGGRPLGVMPSQALLQVLRREHVEDLHRLAGIEREASQARHAIEDPPLRRMRHRLPWLLVGLGGSAVATAAMASFEATLRASLTVAFFVPGIVYLADAIGTQSEAIAVRGLSLSHMRLQHLFAAELRTGLLIGLVLSLLAFSLVWLAFGELRLATAVALALLLASVLASSLGLALPALLQRLGADPAYGSGPLATIIQDVLSLAIYFGCVSLVVL